MLQQQEDADLHMEGTQDSLDPTKYGHFVVQLSNKDTSPYQRKVRDVLYTIWPRD